MNNKDKKVEALKVLKPAAQQLTIKDVISQDQLNGKGKNKIEIIKKMQKKVKREDLVYETDKFVYNFQHFKTIRCLAKKYFLQ